MKTIFRTLMLAGAVIVAAGCGSNTTKTTAAPEVEVTVADPTVSVVEVFTQKVPQEAVYTSTVQAYVKNNIVPQAGNRIKKINVEVGDFVKKGQVLAEMDMTQLLTFNLSPLTSHPLTSHPLILSPLTSNS